MAVTIEERLQNQIDVLEIIQLKAKYCDAADVGWHRAKPDPEEVSSLFVADGVWEANGDFGKAEGSDAIRELFISMNNAFGIHYTSNPIITVDGDTAKGKWQYLCPAIVTDDNVPLWFGGIYNDEFVRTADGWRFKSVKVTIVFTSSNPQGYDVVKTF